MMTPVSARAEEPYTMIQILFLARILAISLSILTIVNILIARICRAIAPNSMYAEFTLPPFRHSYLV